MIESSLAGFLLGLFFYSGLWWTVGRGIASEQAALWFSASLLLRTAVVMGGFLLTAQGQFLRVAACLVGFHLARLAVTFSLAWTQAPDLVSPTDSSQGVVCA
jgi:F1F0 ATPase subunit 2